MPRPTLPEFRKDRVVRRGGNTAKGRGRGHSTGEATMGAMGKYLDTLDDAALDRILMQDGWAPGRYVRENDNRRCLVGAADGWSLVKSGKARSAVRTREHHGRWDAQDAFDRACYRFTPERVGRALKVRAARLIGQPSVPNQTPTRGHHAHV